MIDEGRLKDYIRSKLYEVCNARERFESENRRFFEVSDDLGFWIGAIDRKAADLKSAWNSYETLRFTVHQICWVLGDEYKQIYKDIVGGAGQ
jgi:hypothetical protein